MASTNNRKDGAMTVSLTDQIAVRQEVEGYAHLDRDETIKAIRAALKRRSGKAWSVTGGKGTAYGWITIDAPPKRRTGKHVSAGRDETGRDVYELVDTGEPQPYGLMTPQDQRELTELLGLDRLVHCQGHTIPASTAYRIEAIARAEGRSPSSYGTPYWD